MSEHRRYAEKFLKSFLLKECQEQRKELIEKFLTTFSTIDNIAKSYEIELPKEYYEEWEKWEVKLKDISS